MNDQQVLERIDQLVQEEEALLHRHEGEGLGDREHPPPRRAARPARQGLRLPPPAPRPPPLRRGPRPGEHAGRRHGRELRAVAADRTARAPLPFNPLPPPWRSGYAAACKAVYTSSILVGAFRSG